MEEKDNLKELKDMWEEINNRLTRLEEATFDEGRRVSRLNIRSAQENLAKTYMRFSIMGFVCAVILPLIYGLPDTFIQYPSKTYQIIVALSMCLYFLTAGVMDFYLTNKVKEMDLAEMPVTLVRETALRLKRKHHIFMMILIPLAIAMLTLMTYPIILQTWPGIVIGGVLGLAIGLRAYFKMMKDYREIISA